MSLASPHPEWQTLVDYWLGDTDADATEAIDAHLLQCDACGARIDEIAALGQGVRDAFAGGLVAAVLVPRFVERLKAGGRRVREYRVPAGGSVLCSVAPEDELLVGRVGAALEGVQRLDAVLSQSFAPGEEQRLLDLPFDAAAGEVVFASRIDRVRRLPSHDFVIRLLAVEEAGEHEIGRYTFHHQAAAPAA